MTDHCTTHLTALIGSIIPPVEPHGPRCVRRWIVRVEDSLPERSQLESEAAALMSNAERRIRETFKGSTTEELKNDLPYVRLIRIDGQHCVVEIEFASAATAVADSAAFANYGVLRDIDERWRVEDLEGIPRRFWFFFDRDE